MQTQPRDSPDWMVDTDLGRLHVESAGSGPAVLFWPTLFFGGLSLRAQVEACARDHRVLLVDPPGHGRSDPPRRRFSTDECAQAVLRVLDDAGIERAVLLGNSWGGPVSVATALRAPDRVRGLIVLNAPMHAFSRWRVVQHWFLLQLYKLIGPHAAFMRILMSRQIGREFRAAHPEREEALAAVLRAAGRPGMALAIRSVLVPGTSFLSRLAELRAPTLFIAGAGDRTIRTEISRKEASAIQGSRFEIVEGSAHQSGYEMPERVNELIGEFLRTLPAR